MDCRIHTEAPCRSLYDLLSYGVTLTDASEDDVWFVHYFAYFGLGREDLSHFELLDNSASIEALRETLAFVFEPRDQRQSNESLINDGI